MSAMTPKDLAAVLREELAQLGAGVIYEPAFSGFVRRVCVRLEAMPAKKHRPRGKASKARRKARRAAAGLVFVSVPHSIINPLKGSLRRRAWKLTAKPERK